MFPATVARHTNKDAFKHLGYSNAKRKLGVMVMDYPGGTLIYRIIKTNFDFE